MLVIRVVIGKSKTGNNALSVLISRILNVLLGFEEVSIYHVKHEFNNKANYWAKLACCRWFVLTYRTYWNRRGNSM
jgi:hypothetical protein